MSDRLGIALIGCGEIAVQTSKAVLESRRCRVVHCMDIRRDLAGDLAAKHDARASDRLEDLLADADVRAVVIATPHYLHAPQAIQAARAGKHVLVEKPMACTLTEADGMIAAAEQAGVQLGVLFPMRFVFYIQKARELVAGGAIGRVLGFQFHSMAAKPPHYWEGGYTGRARDEWRKHLASSGGGILIMNLVHNLDAFVYIADPAPQRVYAEYSTLATPVEVEDYVSMVMRLRSGALVSLDASSAAPGRESFGDHVYGEKGQVAFIRSSFGSFQAAEARRGLGVYLEEPHGDLPAGQWTEIPTPPDWPPSRAAYLDAFAEAVASGQPVPVPGHQGRRSLEIIRGAYLSMQQGRPVDFPVRE